MFLLSEKREIFIKQQIKIIKMRRLSLLLLALAATFPDGDETAGEWRNFKYCIANDLPFKAPIYYLDDTPMNTNAYLYANEQETTLIDSKDCYYEARFKVVFSEEATNDIMDSFAYLSNGELVITGNGTLQVMDMLGRQLFTREVSSSLLLPASSLAPGVYVVRLINGNDVKAQKIVVG